MKEKNIVKGVTIGVIILYLGILIGWHVYTPREDLTLQNPGADNRPEGLARAANEVKIGEFFMQYEGEIPSGLTGKWTSFRGDQTRNIIEAPEQLNTGSEEFPVLWSVDTGEGHAAPVIYNGRAYFLDYNEDLSSDALRCFSLETGEELWRRWYRVPIKRNHGFSRTVPAIGDDYIITIGPEGHVMCCDPITGDMKWALDMQKEYGSEVPFWYTGQCPRVDDGILILAPAGEEVLLTGVDVQTGEVVWTTPNTLKYAMSHSSVMPMTLGGKKTYVYIGVGGVCGVSAEEADRGTLLWDINKWQPSVVAPSPLQISSNQIFLVAGYGTGGALLKVDRTGSGWTASIVDQYKPSEGLSSEQQTPILYNNMIISVMPKDGGAQRGRLVCYSPSDLHTPVWTSSSDERFGLGPYLVVNNHLFVFKDDGELYLYEVQQRGMKLLKKQRIMEGADAWGPLAYADGMLIVRDAHVVKCIKVV
ncbi:PQQ-binding-like beta-propeller repeat protein [Parabacteroides sp. PF5-9]|uniref:outer membrane protein assembly factor BamB family protein n=1 Tax=Parabacteroides sp. PF5-9 TaxID=1742404 RepID=UPI00247682A5|nr:PQQ-binding-like beta-propeller repeat protein [Parabacteroides sp. PF5-9]MDH6358474.1 outer membrane protein assembly factor BamB [Parabacteroides sp. PF5-9]